jgi:hypothetical protein
VRSKPKNGGTERGSVGGAEEATSGGEKEGVLNDIQRYTSFSTVDRQCDCNPHFSVLQTGGLLSVEGKKPAPSVSDMIHSAR